MSGKGLKWCCEKGEDFENFEKPPAKKLMAPSGPSSVALVAPSAPPAGCVVHQGQEGGSNARGKMLEICCP